MKYNHQPGLSVNSVQSITEPITPPSLGQMNDKRNHQKSQSLDLSGFNNFISSPAYPQQQNAFINQLINPSDIYTSAAQMNSLSLINEIGMGMERIHTGAYPGGMAPLQMDQIQVRPSHTTAINGSVPSSASSSTLVSSSGITSMAELSAVPLAELDYVKLATDQFGCRFLQKKLELPNGSDTVRDLLYEQIKPILLDLILDPFGNYLIQKLCDYLTEAQRTFLIRSIYPNVFQISINQYGTRSLQKIIDTMDGENQMDLIVKGFSQQFTSIKQVVKLINDLNGNHVIQKCIFKFPTTKFDFIIDAIIHEDNIIAISTHKHGCCVLQKLLSVSSIQQIFNISVKVIQFLPQFINDQFGNYIIQFLLEIKELEFYFLAEIFKRLSNDLCRLSCLKFSSNVIEKFIKKLFKTVIASIKSKNELSKGSSDDFITSSTNIILSIIDIFTSNLNILIRDRYGNYTLQTLLDIKNYLPILLYPENSSFILSGNYEEFGSTFSSKISNLVILTKEMLPSIKTTSYAKKIKLKIKVYSEIIGMTATELSSQKSDGDVSGKNMNHFPTHNQYQNHNLSYNHNNNYSNINNNNSHSLTNNNGNHHKQHNRNNSLAGNAGLSRNNSQSYAVNQNVQPHSNFQSTNLNLNFNSPNILSLNQKKEYIPPRNNSSNYGMHTRTESASMLEQSLQELSLVNEQQRLSKVRNSIFSITGKDNVNSSVHSVNNFGQVMKSSLINDFAFSSNNISSQGNNGIMSKPFLHDANAAPQRVSSHPFQQASQPFMTVNSNFRSMSSPMGENQLGFKHKNGQHFDYSYSSEQ